MSISTFQLSRYLIVITLFNLASSAFSQTAEGISSTALNIEQNGNAIQLRWNNTTDITINHFELERSYGENNYQIVASLLPDNSSSNPGYIYNDMLNGFSLSNWYRLKIIHNDGGISYSIPKLVETGTKAGIIIYPNPSPNGQVRITFDPTYNTSRDIIISELTGGLVKQYNRSPENTFEVHNLVRGVYNVRAIDRTTGQILMGKIIVN